MRALELESQPLWNGAALCVAGGAADLYPVQIHLAEQMRDGYAAGVGDNPAALKLMRQPVAEFDAPIAPVDAVGADHSGHASAMPDAGGKSIMRGEHFERRTNESDYIVFRPGRIHPGQPLSQVLAVALHRREQFSRLMFLQQAKFE